MLREWSSSFLGRLELFKGRAQKDFCSWIRPVPGCGVVFWRCLVFNPMIVIPAFVGDANSHHDHSRKTTVAKRCISPF